MTLPETMKAVRLTGHGGLDKLEWCDDVPVPQPDAGEVLIRVGASAVNNTDVNTRTGWYSKAVRAPQGRPQPRVTRGRLMPTAAGPVRSAFHASKARTAAERSLRSGTEWTRRGSVSACWCGRCTVRPVPDQMRL